MLKESSREFLLRGGLYQLYSKFKNKLLRMGYKIIVTGGHYS